MASYTMQLREYIESYSQDNEMLSNRDRIKIGREKLFDFEYPIFDKDYKAVFETNFIRNFYMREIGFESEGLFKFQLETWLLINMPYYNKLFESELIKFNPLESYSLKTTYQKKNDVKQDENRNRTQNDNKIIEQNDKTKNNENEVQNNIQTDSTSRTQNDKSNKTQIDDRDIIQNDETNLSQNGNTTTDTTNSNNETTNRESTVDSESNTENKVDRENKGKSTETTDDFSRQIDSDTPDTRLQLTAKDGEGAIEYASKITENTDNDKKTATSESTEKQNETSDSTSLVTTKEDGSTSNEGDSHSDTKVVNDEQGTLTSTIGDKLVSDTTDTFTSNIKEDFTTSQNNQKNNTTDGSLESKINDNLTSDVKDSSVSTINDIEDYIEEKVGSIGVKTYSEMIMEYRESLLRIEKQIFKEMNELFMLVY